MSSACALGTVTSYRGQVSNTSPATGCLAGLADSKSVTDMSTSTRLRLVPKAVSPGACLQSKAVKGTKRYLASSVTAQALHSVLWACRSTKAMAGPKVEYVLFDMDGLLIDTESIYTKVTNEILAPYGAEMTWDIKAGLMGKLERDAAAYLLSFFPDIPLTIDTYLSRRTVLQDTHWPTVQPLPGLHRGAMFC